MDESHMSTQEAGREVMNKTGNSTVNDELLNIVMGFSFVNRNSSWDSLNIPPVEKCISLMSNTGLKSLHASHSSGLAIMIGGGIAIWVI